MICSLSAIGKWFSRFFSFYIGLFLILCTSRFANFARGKWSNHDSKNCSEIKTVTWLVICLWKLKFSISTTRLLTTSQFQFQNSSWNHDWTIFLLQNWKNVRYIKWEKAQCKMRKSEKTTFQWPKVSRLLITLPRHRHDFRTCLRFLFPAPVVPFLKWLKAVKVAFFSL